MNKQLILAKRPEGLPDASTWKLQDLSIPEPKEGEVLIKQHYISLDLGHARLDARREIIH